VCPRQIRYTSRDASRLTWYAGSRLDGERNAGSGMRVRGGGELSLTMEDGVATGATLHATND
jgi:hypothetical protein